MNRRLFLRAMAGTAAAVSLPAPALQAQAPLGKLAVLVTTTPPDVTCHHFWYAQEQGFFRAAGIEVAIQSIANDPTTVRGVIAGEGDVGWCGSASALQAIATGAKIKILSSFAPRLDYLVVARQEIPDLKALAGKAFAVSQVGAVSQTVPKMMVDLAGGDGTSVKWLSVGGSAARLQALIAKRVDATLLNSPYGQRASTYPGLHAIGNAIKDLPHFQYSWEIVSLGALAKKRPALQAFVRALRDGIAWAEANPKDAARISQNLLPDVDPGEVAGIIETYMREHYFSATGAVEPADWDFTMAEMTKNGDIATPLAYEDVVLADFTKP